MRLRKERGTVSSQLRRNCIITAEQAIAIYNEGRDRKVRSPLAREVGAKYGLSRKAVRDIWKGRTWSKVTKMEGPSLQHPPLQSKIMYSKELVPMQEKELAPMQEMDLGPQMPKSARGKPRQRGKSGIVQLTKEEAKSVWDLRGKKSWEEVAVLVGGNLLKQKNIKETIHRIWNEATYNEVTQTLKRKTRGNVSDDVVREIRRVASLARGLKTATQIGKPFGVRGDIVTKILEGKAYRGVKDLDDISGKTPPNVEKYQGDDLAYLGDLTKDVGEMSLQETVVPMLQVQETAVEMPFCAADDEVADVEVPWTVMPDSPTNDEEHDADAVCMLPPSTASEFEIAGSERLFGEAEDFLSPISKVLQERKLTTTPVFIDSSSEDSDDEF